MLNMWGYEICGPGCDLIPCEQGPWSSRRARKPCTPVAWLSSRSVRWGRQLRAALGTAILRVVQASARTSLESSNPSRTVLLPRHSRTSAGERYMNSIWNSPTSVGVPDVEYNNFYDGKCDCFPYSERKHRTVTWCCANCRSRLLNDYTVVHTSQHYRCEMCHRFAVLILSFYHELSRMLNSVQRWGGSHVYIFRIYFYYCEFMTASTERFSKPPLINILSLNTTWTAVTAS